MHVDMIAHVQF